MSRLPTTDDADFTIKMLYEDSAQGTIIYGLFAINTLGTLRFAPSGTVAGQPKGECACYVTGRSMPIQHDGAVEFDVNLVRTGEWIAEMGNGGTW